MTVAVELDTQLTDQVLKTKKVRWKDLIVLQPPELKTFPPANYQKLRRSLISKGYSDPFKVWENDKKIYVIDGVHRIQVMKDLEKEGFKFPETVTANFIKCEDEKDATEKILIYSSQYAKVSRAGLTDLITDRGLDFQAVDLIVEIPSMNIPSMSPDFQENIQKQTIKEEYQLSYVFTAEQRNVVEKAIKKAGTVFKTKNANEALFSICKTYIED